MGYVNIHGEPVAVGNSSGVKVKKSTPDSYHKGWTAMGFSPDQIAEARRVHEALIRSSSDSRKPPPFDPDTWLRAAKPRKIRSRPYEIREAALQACELAEKSGWLRCTAEPKVKGASS